MRINCSVSDHIQLNYPTPLEVGCLKIEVVNVVCQVQAHAHKMCTGGSRGGSLGSIEPPFEKEVSGRLKQLVSKLFTSFHMHFSLTFSPC